jgi:REP element-mobilizing transposase RayT
MAMAFQSEKHHRQSIRLRNYDYTSSGAYFITICTYQKEHLFGRIEDGRMILNEIGSIVNDEWFISSDIRREIKLDAFVIMPNHIHGIVWIVNGNDTKNPLGSNDVVGARAPSPLPQTLRVIGTGKKSLGLFVGGFKSLVTKRINQHRQTPRIPVWQRNYYERVIRNDDELNAVRTYIENNSKHWQRNEDDV